jgi:AcrR family transcriptional regulator
MGARAEAVRETRTRILAAAGEALLKTDYGAITLQMVGESCGVSVQTIIRHFESKDRLFREAFEVFDNEVASEMERVEVGDIRGAIEALHSRYEWMGDGNIRMLAQEESTGLIADGMRSARKMHRDWVERTFEPYLPSRGDPARRKRLFQFLIVTDVYTWKLVRRDHGGSRVATTETIIELTNAIVRQEGEAQ